MVSSSPAHQRNKKDAGAVAPQRLSKSAVSLVPCPKPLTKHKFYLDVKNHITSGKLEAKIKDLGGVLELFLVKEVTHVVTDREEWLSGSRGVGTLPRTPHTPQASSQDASVGDHLHSTPVRGRPKTRADAMLERARRHTPTQQLAANVKDPLEQAKTLGIPVWSVEKALTWLEKVTSVVAAERQKTRRKCRVVELKSPFVKFEAFDRRHRPVFKEIRNWPSFNLKGEPGSAGVLHKPAGEQIMTKSRAPPQRNKVRSIPVQSGYCELCREEYQSLDEHLESKKHLTFIKDNNNFLELDSLIHNGTDLHSFLKINNEIRCNGVVASPKHSSRLLHKMPRTRTSSINDCNVNKVKNTPVSPTGSETGHRLRVRKSNMTYIGLTVQEQEEQVKPEGAREVREARELRSANKTTQLKAAESDTWSSGRPKRACLRQKRNSFLDETGLHEESKGYYKVEMTPKLRSSAVGTPYQKDIIEIKKSPIPEQIEPLQEQFEDEKSLIVKFRRIPTSELRQLNNEAENFLFPKKDDSSSEEDIDNDCRDTTASTVPRDSIVISSETDTETEDSDHDDECCDKAGLTECKKRRRMTHAEAFIEDNKKYYKFVTPDSRLRYHGSSLSGGTLTSTPRKCRLNGDFSDAKDEMELTADKYDCDNKVEDKKDDCKFTLEDFQFSFEAVPKSEPWYETFSRQDQGLEYYTCFSDSGYWKPFLLPYQMDRIQPLDPKVCILTYTQIKKLLAEGSSGSNSTPSCSTPDCSAQGSPAPETDENSKASEDFTINQFSENPPRPMTKKRRRNKGILVPSKNPRKSPRQHASTLAILSSLIQHRKKRKSSPNNTLDSINNTLDSIPEASESQNEGPSEEKQEEHNVMDKVVESIDDMLSNAFGDLEQVEMSLQDDVDKLDFSCKSNAIEILEDYENYKHVERKTGLIGSVRRSYSPGKKPGRKKKKNRTGWPKNHIRKTNLNSVLSKTLECHPETVKVCANVNSKPNSVVKPDRVKLSELDGSVSSVDLDKWENAEKVLSAKITNDANKEHVRALASGEEESTLSKNNRRLRSSSSPPRGRSNGAKRARRMPASPKSPRVLRKPRGRWYRER